MEYLLSKLILLFGVLLLATGVRASEDGHSAENPVYRERLIAVANPAAGNDKGAKEFRTPAGNTRSHTFTILLATGLTVMLLETLLLWRSRHQIHTLRDRNKAMSEVIAKMHFRGQPPYAGSPEDDGPGNAHPDREESVDQKLLELFGQLDRKIQEQRLFLNPGLSREDLMRLINSSKNQIAQIIQVGAGTNLAGYLNGLRIEYAADLLVFHPHYKVMVIAREAGIPNLSSFHRLFKMRYGMTPAEFRKMRAA